MSDYWKKKMEELEKETKKSPSQSYWDRKKVELEEEDDIAPIKSVAKTKEKEDDDGLDFFQKSSLFDDGWDFGDVTKTILGSVGDAGLNVVKGAGSLVEGITDLGSYGVAWGADAIGKDDFAEDLRKKTQESYVDKLLKPAEDYLDKSSVFGRTSDAILQGVGQVGGIMATGGLGAAAGLGATGVTALTTGTMFASGTGSGIGEAYKGGANDLQALKHGLNSGAADAVSELIFGGLGKGINALGFSKGLSSADDILAKLVGSKFKNQIAKNIVEFGIKSGAEGLEEVIAGVAQGYSKYNTYLKDQGVELEDVLKDENLLEQFVVGSFTSGLAQGSGLHIANKTGSDFITGLNQNEQAVVKKEIENRIAEAEKDGKKLTAQEKSKIEAQVEKYLDKGYISTDLIEEVVGGETYKAYRDSVDQEDALFKEYEELGKATNPTLAQQYRYRELDSRVKSIKDNDIRSRRKEHLDQFVSEQVNGTRLAESYNERTRRGQAFEADLTKYDKKQQAVIQKAVESGILNNTNRTHEFVDMVAKISADKGVLFDFTNNEKLKTSGFAVDGKAVNGYVNKDGITVNIQSSKALNSVVGHEIAHVLEGTDLYTELQNTVVEYAKAKGDYQGRFDSLSKLYEGIEGADINAELTADLVGDYLFTDQDFINNLSVNNRNVFQKIYDEVKYLLKVATAGSKEARQLEKVKRTFEKAYRENGKKQTGTKNSLSETTDGRFVAVVDNDILSNIDTSSWDDAKKSEAKKAAAEALKQFKDGIVVDGVTRKVNKVSRREYTRSKYTEWLYDHSPDVFSDKMRAADVADDIVVAATNWQRDGGLKHPRTDDFVDFDHGRTLIVSGNARYTAEVVVGITSSGDAVFYDVVDMTPATFDVKKEESPATATTQNAIGDIKGDSSETTLPQNGESVKRSLSAKQQEYFKDSKVRDENGNLMVMYHGTPNGDFTVFKDGTYFTPDKEYADRYQNPGASSIRTGKVASAPKTFEVYLDIKKPFDINDAEARSIYINDYIKGGNAMGINPYLSDAEYAKINTIDWTEGEDLRDFLIENEYDYDGIVLDEGATGGYGDDVQSRGKSYVVFSPEQVKSIDNKNPTSDPDIRFSLSEAVEETKDLIAVHNLQASELPKALALGGMPMPSIAIIKAQQSHESYGDVSLIFPKDVIDPQKNKDNKIYGGDAWTPVYPSIEYKANAKVQKAIEAKIDGLVPYDVQRGLGHLSLDYDNISSDLNRYNGEMYRAYQHNYAMQYAFLVDNGFSEQLPMTEKQLDGSGRFDNSVIVDVVAKLGSSEVERLANESIYDNDALISELRELANENAKAKYAGDSKLLEVLRNRPLYTEKNFGFAQADSMIRAAYRYITKGVEQTVDYKNARDVIEKAVDKDAYKKWLDNLFADIVEKEGIRNNADFFTPSGNRRSWEALHWENTLENVLKVMKAQNQTGQGFFGGASIFGVANKNYGSIGEVKADSDRLRTMPEEEYEALKSDLSNRLAEIADSIKDPNERNRFIALDNAVEEIVDAVRARKTKSGILQYMQKWNKRVTKQTVEDIVSLVNDIANMPTGYFEAKPQRAVGFDEVGVFVIPYDADVKLKQELLNRGYSIAEYDPKVEGDRQRVVNQFEEFKFSLSDVGTGPKTYGSYNVYGKDIALEAAPVTEEIAPVAENATTEASNATPNATNATPNATNATPVLASEEMFPDDLAPVQQELENLMAEQDELRQALETAVSVGDYEQISGLTADYESVTARIRELQAQEDERFNTLGDSDMPPEVEAPYPGEPSDVPDPFAERDMVEVGKRSVKAYQYENPEVKPFFQEAAYGMLGDLRSGTKGEKIFNGDLYYQSGGEEGWMGTKRNTTSDIADLLDTWHYTYDEIEKGLNAIIEDDGKENNAVSKRIEFMLDDRLRNGYTGVWGEPIPANQEYINLLKEKQVTEYSKEAFDRFMATADQYAPPVDDIAPVRQKPRSGYAASEQMKLPLYHDPNNVSPAMDEVRADGDIAPVFETESGQQAFMPDADVPKAVTRKELHTSIIDNIKTKFAEKGFDFDAVLKKAKNLSTFSTVDNIPQRVMEKALGYKEGGILSDITVNKVAQNETQGIKWLNSFTDRKNGLLAQISKQYNIKPGSKESAAAQMYAEGFYVGENNEIIQYGDRELAADFPDVVKQAQIKGLARDKRIRLIYDDTLKAINESRTRNAYPEIPRLDNYFLHFRAMSDTFSQLGLPFNPNDIRAKDLPTDLNGVTADLKPGQPFFASAMHREGKRTSFDLLGGLEQYLTSAKNQIYHIDDIQNLRALRNYIADTYGQANGLEGLDALSEEEQQERIEQVYGSHLSTFAKFLNEEANMLAGKTALIDRGLEGIIGRRGMTFLDTLNRQVGANMVGYNVSSSLTNFLAPVQAFAKSNKAAFIKGMAQLAANKVNSVYGKGDGFAENSPVMIRRKGAERFHRTLWQKMSDPGYALMGAVDDISTELIARAKYNELTAKGMNSQQAHIETDKWVSRLMGDRSIGQQPQLYNSKMLGIFTKFQLEVRNQLDSQFYDTIQEAKVSNEYIANRLERNAKTAAKVTSTFVQLAIGQHLFGKVFESVAGYNPAFDIISAIVKAFGWDDDEEDEDTVLDNLEQGFFELMEDMPYYSIFSGGRIPIESALPVAELIKGKDQYGNEKSRWETVKEAAPYYFMPGGYGQIKKTVAGLNMFSDEHPVAGSYTDSGNLRFPVEDNLVNRAQAAIFGQYASGNARDYFDNERSALKEKQIQEFADAGLSIQDYWKYRDGLKDLSKLEEKINYINGLNLTTAQKNVLVNNLTDRKEAIDMADYDQYGSLDEFDYATKNPEKYAFFEEIGISYNTYKNAGDDARKAYDWALENPDKYPMSKAIAGDVVEYRRYTSDLNDLKADKDSSGKSISGSGKDKVIDYINSLDIDYGAKLILFKSEYKSDNESNYQIVEYLNSRSDISYEEMVAILSELDFTVTEDGTVYWD